MSYGQYGGSPQFAMPALTPAIKRLLIANGVVFLANMLLAGRLGQWFGVTWSGLWEGYGLGLLRLVSYQFTHSFTDPFHLIWNMLVLYFFGTMAEAGIGYRGTYKLYLLAGMVGAALHMGFAALTDVGDLPLIGASGACYGLLVYAACMAPHSTVILIIIPIKLWVLAAILVGVGVYQMYVELALGGGGGVAHSAHVGGAAFGFLAHRFGWLKDWTPYAYQEGLWSGLRKKLRQWRQTRRHDNLRKKQQRLDALLEKVHRDGIGSLSRSERRFLEQASDELKKR